MALLFPATNDCEQSGISLIIHLWLVSNLRYIVQLTNAILALPSFSEPSMKLLRGNYAYSPTTQRARVG